MNLVVGFITYNDNSSKYLSKFWPSLEKSLEKLKKIIKPGTIVYPGHGEIFEPR